jgi:hypothetical protein
MKRRDFLLLLGSAPAAPALLLRTARAQPAIPVIGFLHSARVELDRAWRRLAAMSPFDGGQL